ncbi:MAG: hypothetical protein Q8K55_10830, partial [Gemmatimonadaceae bacterium]|nr:hypothetical protein [Gemmatimonadaceae bacterium]
ISENMHFTDRAAMIKVQLALLKQINAGNTEKVKQLITGGVDIELGVLARYADIPVTERDNYVIEAITIAHNFRNKYPHETNKDLVGPIAKTLPLVDPSYKDPYN